MWLSVVSPALFVAALWTTTPDKAEAERVWESARESLLEIESRSAGRGYAILIDRTGLFLVSSSLVDQAQVWGRTPQGTLVSLDVVSNDEVTQFALLLGRSMDQQLARMKPVRLAARPEEGWLLAGLPSGALRGEWVGSNRVGLMKPNSRYLPLTEMRFETPSIRFGGAPVFNSDGELVAIVSATLEPVATKKESMNKAQYGPTGLTVAYSLGPRVIQRVVDGFRSPSRFPKHPTIGAFFGEGKQPGALVVDVTKGSPSDDAGLRIGDLIVSINETEVEDRFDLVRALFDQVVGEVVELKVRRPGQEALLNLKITIGDQRDLATRR